MYTGQQNDVTSGTFREQEKVKAITQRNVASIQIFVKDEYPHNNVLLINLIMRIFGYSILLTGDGLTAENWEHLLTSNTATRTAIEKCIH